MAVPGGGGGTFFGGWLIKRLNLTRFRLRKIWDEKKMVIFALWPKSVFVFSDLSCKQIFSKCEIFGRHL
jgi:hypothetical protein